MWKIRKFSIILIIMIFSITMSSCSFNKERGNKSACITVSAASSLEESMIEIKKIYEAENDIEIIYNFGGSGTLKNQIVNGADVDVFISANSKYIDEAINNDIISNEAQGTLLKNSLVVIKSETAEDISSIDDLYGREGIAIGEPSVVPAGEYAKEAAINTGIWSSIEDDVIYAKDVSAVRSYVEQGNADYGFVYKSDALTLKNGEIALYIGDDVYSEAIYKYGIVSKTKHKEEAEKFVNFLLSDEASQIFKSYGFT